MNATRTVDIHSHMVPSDIGLGLEREFTKYAPTFTTDDKHRAFLQLGEKTVGPFTMDFVTKISSPEQRLKDIGQGNIDVQAICVPPSNYYYDIPTEAGVAICKAQNRAISRVVKRFPDRFVGIATVPLQDVESAIEVVDDAVTHLGMRGVEINTNIQGKDLDWTGLHPFYEKICQLDVLLLVHPDRVAGMMGLDRLLSYYLFNLLGNPIESSVAFASVVFGGVLDKFPNLKLCFVHGGGFIPYQRGRLDRGFEHRHETRVCITREPSSYLKKVYFDTITHYSAALQYLVDTIGATRILMGSDYPFDMGDPHPVKSVESIQLDDERKGWILGRNAEHLLKIGS